MDFRRFLRRVKDFVAESGPLKLVLGALKDPRKAKGRQWSLKDLITPIVEGVMSDCRTLKDVERMTELTGCRVPHGTLLDLLHKLDPAPLEGVVVAQVKHMHRIKALAPDGVPIGMIAIDNKDGKTLDHEGDVDCLRSEGHFRSRHLRAALISSRSMPVIGQAFVPKRTNDLGAFPLLWEQIMRHYGKLDLFELVTMDAGFCYESVLRLIDESCFAYLVGVKENQKTLLYELRRLFLLFNPPRVAWTDRDPTPGGRIKRELFRLDQKDLRIAGWPHLRQALLVRQTMRKWSGCEVVVERLFITNLTWNRLTPEQLLRAVRRHWGIENNCNKTFDTVLNEDTVAWATNRKCLPDSVPLRVMSWLRVIAYNWLGWVKLVHLRGKNRKMPWAFLRRLLWLLLVAPKAFTSEIVTNLLTVMVELPRLA